MRARYSSTPAGRSPRRSRCGSTPCTVRWPSSMSSSDCDTPAEPDGGRHNGGDHVGARLQPPFEAGDAVTSSDAGMKLLGIASRMQAMVSSSAASPPGSHVGERRPRLRDERHDAHLLPPGRAHGDDGACAVGSRVADTGEQAVLHEQAGAPSGGASLGALLERLPTGADARTAPAYASPDTAHTSLRRPHAGRRSEAAGSTPGETMTGVPVASGDGGHELRCSAAGSSWISGSSPMVRSSSTTPEAARSRQMSTTSSGSCDSADTRRCRRGRSRTRSRCDSRWRSRRTRRGTPRRRWLPRSPRAAANTRSFGAGRQQLLELRVASRSPRRALAQRSVMSLCRSTRRSRRRAGRRAWQSLARARRRLSAESEHLLEGQPLGGLVPVSGRPTGTSATSRAGGATPSICSMAGAASTGPVIQHEP